MNYIHVDNRYNLTDLLIYTVLNIEINNWYEKWNECNVLIRPAFKTL